MNRLPDSTPGQSLHPTTYSATENQCSDSGSTVSPINGQPSGVTEADFVPHSMAEKKDTEISSRQVAVNTGASETTGRRPILDFENKKDIVYMWSREVMPRSQVSYQENRRDEYRERTDITSDGLADLIVYQQHSPEGFIRGDAITFGPLTSSEFDQLCNFLEKDLSLTPDNTTIVDAGSGPFCYHSALFALAGFAVRPYDSALIRSGYAKLSHSQLEKILTPFLKPNDKDLTGDDITPDFFDESSVLFMSFPDGSFGPISTPLIKKYTESAALNKVIVLLIHSYDEDGKESISVSKETSEFLKENYELRKKIHTDRFTEQPTQVQIHVRRALQ